MQRGKAEWQKPNKGKEKKQETRRTGTATNSKFLYQHSSRISESKQQLSSDSYINEDSNATSKLRPLTLPGISKTERNRLVRREPIFTWFLGLFQDCFMAEVCDGFFSCEFGSFGARIWVFTWLRRECFWAKRWGRRRGV